MTFFPIKSSEFGRVTPSAIAIAERFWKHVDKTPGHGPKGECWVWIGDRHPKGYGKMYFQFPRAVCRKKEKPFRAHRISWLLYRGLIPHHFHVLHHCDTPACVRPDHLFLGKDKDNYEDALAKGRRRSAASGFRGVILIRKTGKYVAQQLVNGQKFYLGMFDTAEEAAAKREEFLKGRVVGERSVPLERCR